MCYEMWQNDTYLEEVYSQTHLFTVTKILESLLEKYKPFLVSKNCNESYIALHFWNICASFLLLSLFLLKYF